MRLNRRKDFGTITPPFVLDGFDRPAFYEQNLNYFDAHDRQIIAGTPLEDMPAEEPEKPDEAVFEHTASSLIEAAEDMDWNDVLYYTKRVLGALPKPSSKANIMSTLRNVALHEDEPKKTMGLTWDKEAGKPEPVAAEVDLAAWARGTTDYLFGEVQKAVRSKHNKHVTERRDAVNFLVDEGVIRANEARQDV